MKNLIKTFSLFLLNLVFFLVIALIFTFSQMMTDNQNPEQLLPMVSFLILQILLSYCLVVNIKEEERDSAPELSTILQHTLFFVSSLVGYHLFSNITGNSQLASRLMVVSIVFSCINLLIRKLVSVGKSQK